MITQALADNGAVLEVIGLRDGTLDTVDGDTLDTRRLLVTVSSVLYDAVLVPGGRTSVDALAADGQAVHFVAEAFKRGKAVAGIGEGVHLLTQARLNNVWLAGPGDGLVVDQGVVSLVDVDPGYWGGFTRALVEAVRHRHWERDMDLVPA